MMKAFAPRLFPVIWQLFNITFICLYQHVLLLLIALPAWVAQQSSEPLSALDGVAAALFAALLLLETVADQQQWVFQQSKRKLLPQRCVPGALRSGRACTDGAGAHAHAARAGRR
jgi:steroid 5-alpha reductase family enzyme